MKYALFTFIVFIATVSAQDRGMAPVALGELLKALPEKVEGWSLTKSQGSSGWDEWLTSEAAREFEQEQIDGETVIVRKTSLTLRDTGGYAPAFALFANFTPAKGDRFEKKLMGEYPAIIIAYGENKFEGQLLVKKRFLVRIVCENQPLTYLNEWLERIALRNLNAMPEGELIELPSEIIVREVDELDDSKSRSYPLAITSPERADEESIAEQEEDLGEE